MIAASDYCFAKQYLAESGQNCKIRIDGKQILGWDGKPNYEITPIKTAIILGEPLTEQSEIQEVRSYKQLLDWGFMIITSEPNPPWFPGQKVHYKIVPGTTEIQDVGMLPIKRADHYIEFDAYNKRIRLMGRNAGPLGRGPWIDLEPKAKPRPVLHRPKYRLEDYQRYADQILLKRMERWGAYVDTGPQMIEIKELPVMISESNEIVCIPKEHDIPRIGCVGKVGCLDPFTKILVHNVTKGNYETKTIKELYHSADKYCVFSLNKLCRVEEKQLMKVTKKDGELLFEVGGYLFEVLATRNHEFITLDKEGKMVEKQLKDLKIGDYIPQIMGVKHPDNITKLDITTKEVDWRKIEHIEPKKTPLEVYDLQVQDNDNVMLANGLIVHNSGKTFQMNGIVGRIKYKWNDMILLLNDSVNQTFSWALPNQSIGFARLLDKIEEHPMPYPLVFLYPMFTGLETIKFEKEGIGFRISLPFAGVVENYNYFFQGKKEWLLGDSQKYFRQLKEQISQCKSIERVEQEITDGLSPKKGLQPTINKLTAVMEDLWDYNFLDVSSGIPSRWTFEEGGRVAQKYPWIGLYECGVMPVINTAILKLKHFYPQYLRFIIDTVYADQIEKERKNKQKRVWLAIDEIGNIYKRGNRKTPAAEALVTAVTEGRNHQLGTIYTIQNYSMLDTEIRSNTNYLFSLVYSNADEINAIARDFDLGEKDKDDLKTLAPHEMLAISNDKPFVVYHPDGQRYERTGVFRGFGLPPLSQHAFPGARI